MKMKKLSLSLGLIILNAPLFGFGGPESESIETVAVSGPNIDLSTVLMETVLQISEGVDKLARKVDLLERSAQASSSTASSSMPSPSSGCPLMGKIKHIEENLANIEAKVLDLGNRFDAFERTRR